MSDVTVIGLGQMGTRLVELLRNSGRSVTVWNRNSAKAAAIASDAVSVAPNPAAAIAASPVTLIILSDDEAVRSVFDHSDIGEALAQKIIINLGTTGPDQARAFYDRVADRGGNYLDGAIQAAPSQMGEPSTPIILSGSTEAFERAETLLRILAGNLIYLGHSKDASAFMDLATLSYVYGAYAGFLHGVRISEVTGIDPGLFGKLVESISPSFGAFFAHQSGVIKSGDFAISESPMRISIAAVDRIAKTSAALGINGEVPELVNGWLVEAERQGFADEELAAIIKVLR
ncbi:NAD(P)-binding domain-containing protein [Asticcacaulis sp. DXS10W]|uniref:NAD(P)-binding domain-containing protein n=2 Tax=Asticcacaulis currens TaxID=2984210 RepID=A0ABT5IDG3_9CAUL|nr:NAD(P)-binding domain-containing protein [Asticcacaulis currens]MDC7694232.1 NAD(P)-binding domain-containing protein [Asticcacaulis currens]